MALVALNGSHSAPLPPPLFPIDHLRHSRADIPSHRVQDPRPGVAGRDAQGNLVGTGDILAQTRQVFDNIKECLEAVGAGFDNVVKINVYLTDIDNQLAAVGEVRQEYFVSSPSPAPRSGCLAWRTLTPWWR